MITKCRGKRTMDVRIVMTFLLLTFLWIPSAATQVFDDYWKAYQNLDYDIDHSSLILCYSMDGKIELVDKDNAEKGFKCTGYSQTFVENNKQAMEFCTSKAPYHIIKAEPMMSTGGVSCVFQINLKCENGWTQIQNKCYQLTTQKLTFDEAIKHCKSKKPNLRSGLAFYYDGPLNHFLKGLFFAEAWVNVDEISNDPGITERGVLIMNAGYKYDVRPGTLLLFDPQLEFKAICEYSPPMKMAEMYLMAGIYSEIYPIHVTTNGASFSTSSYLTIEQLKLTKNSKGKYAEVFTTENIRERCKNIGNIIGVDSHPMASIEEEFDTVKEFLTEHRFHLTSAFKNEGCQRTTYQDMDGATGTLLEVYRSVHDKKNDYGFCNAFSFSFHPYVSMRTDKTNIFCFYVESSSFDGRDTSTSALLSSLDSFSYEYGDCDSGWIPIERSKTTRFCHYIYAGRTVIREEAVKACLAKNSVLTGFETSEEFEELKKHIKTNGHYWLGGVNPCAEDCTDPTYKASWDRGVSRNTKLLNSLESNLYPWGRVEDPFISYRSDGNEFHTHAATWKSYYICGKYPPMIVKKVEIKDLKKNGK